MKKPTAVPFKVRLFGVLWLMGLPGVLSLVALPLPAEIPAPALLVKGLILIQPTFLLSLAVLVGVQLAATVKLAAPGAEALAKRQNWRRAIAPQIWPGVVGGVVSGVALVAIAVLSRSWLPDAFGAAPPTPLIVRFLYGGLTEEILLRWGMMTLLLWLGWRFGQGRRGVPKIGWVGLAIAGSALLFAAAHLPYMAALGLPLTPLLVGYLLLQNSLFALVAGYLYWRFGLESAIVAHLIVHGVMLIGT